jgi:hypothetical protein
MIQNNKTPNDLTNLKSLFNMCVLFSMFFFGHKATSQTLTPFTMNNGGGYSNMMEWSIVGESVSIAHFGASGYFLNTGMLQPSSVKGNEYGPSALTDITIGPIPTSNLLHIKIKFNTLGTLLLQLTDAKSALVFSKEVAITSSSYENDITMKQYASGVFFLRVYFKPTNGDAKTGIYKIVKI